MRVNNQVGNSTYGTDAASTRKADQAGKAASSREVDKTKAATDAEASADASTEISPRAKEMATAKAIATAAPDLREAKIAELKKRIANKEYNVKPEAIADKMVDEHIRTRSISNS